MIVRSNVLNLQSNVYYMTNFTFEHDIISGEFGFALSSLEAVLHYIESNIQSLTRMSTSTAEFWASTISGNLDEIRDAFLLNQEGGLSSLSSPTSPVSPSEREVINSRNWNGDNALLLAIQQGHTHIVTYLLSQGVSAEVENYQKDTPLHLAAKGGFTELVDILLKYCTLVDLTNIRGDTPLTMAAQYGHIDITSLLLDHHASINHQNLSGNSAVHLANCELVQFLVAKGASLSLLNTDGLTPLLFHLQQGNLDVVKFLLSTRKCDINAFDLGHRTPLHLCAFRGYKDVLQAIFDIGGVSVNLQSMRGNTALHAAADAGHLEIVRILLLAGSDPTAINLQGKTASDLSRNEFIRDLLDDYSLFMREDLKQGDRSAAVVRSHVEGDALKFIIKSGTYPDVQSITTVRRMLTDFGFLRQQLQVEFPEAALYDLIYCLWSMFLFFAGPIYATWSPIHFSQTGSTSLLE